MMRGVITFGVAAMLASGAVHAADRPAITGISHIAVYAADPAAADRFYAVKLGAEKHPDPEDAKGAIYRFSPQQYVEVLPLPAGEGINRLAHVAFSTRDAAKLRAYLAGQHAREVSQVRRGADGEQWFSVRDPEGNLVQFVQPATTDTTPARAPSAAASSISASRCMTARRRTASTARCSASGLTGGDR